MATYQLAEAAAAETILTTGLNSLANNDSQISAAISNDAAGERYPLCMAELYLAAQGSARSAGAAVELYLLPTFDGTNYSYGSDSLVPAANRMVGAFQFDAATDARYASCGPFALPPKDFELVVANKTGQAFASANNVLKIIRYKMESVA